MGLLANENAISGGGYTISNSVRTRAAATAYFNRTPASAGNQKTWTWSAWIKRGALGSIQSMFDSIETYIQFNASDIIEINLRGAATNYIWTTSQLFRDPSAWYHIVLAVDTTQATATNRMKLYVNGSQVTSFASSATIPQNTDTRINSTSAHYIGSYTGTLYYLDGYQAEVNFVNAQQLTPSSFGSTNTQTGVWQPIRYTGTYGTNGFYLQFSDIATTSGSNAGLGKDFSGNGNYWNTTNISVTSGVTYDAMIDSPTNSFTSTTRPVGNYAVLNPLSCGTGQNTIWTFSEANLKAASTSAGQNQPVYSTIGVKSGKWYAEFTAGDANNAKIVGIGYYSSNSQAPGYPSANSVGYYYNGQKFTNNSLSAYGSSYTTNDVIGVALDMDAGTCTFYKNNVSQGVALSGITSANGEIYFQVSDIGSGATATWTANFGQRPFTYTPPTGFQALCTTNLPDSTVVKGNIYMDATTYTGNASTQSIVNAGGFKPDMVWTKSRANAYNHDLYDSVRGPVNSLFPNLTNANSTLANTLTSFNSNGFTLGSNDDSNFTNGSSAVAWQWQAGQGTTSSNTSGSITSTTSVNTTAGFSVVTYTGTGANATVGHGLGVAPAMIIVKRRNSTSAWPVRHTSITAANSLYLNTTAASAAATTVWNSTAPTSTVFSIGTSTDTNANTGTYVAYCFAEIAGFSKFGSYTGNGSTDGPFNYLGFRPKYVMIKRTDTTGSWAVLDTSRNPYNLTNIFLYPNLTNADDTQTVGIDIVSNGFKLRTSGAGENGSGGTFIYMAFAENPFKNALAR